MKYIVYKTINKVNNKIYIGVHKTKNPEVFDGYIGNGVWVDRPSSYLNPTTHFKKAVLKYGVESFYRTTIKIFNTEDEAYLLEQELVTKEFVEREDTYNAITGGNTSDRWKVPVYMYSLEGIFEKEFSSLTEAALYLNPDSNGAGHLPRAIKLHHQFLGHQFSYNKEDKIPPIKALKNRTNIAKPYIGKKVGKYDKNGVLIHIYNTMTDCVKDGYKNAKLVAEGKRLTCNGYIFKYID